MVKEVEFIVSGDVQGVGYRQYVAKVGRKLKFVGLAENLKDGTVRIHCKGEEKAISEFRKLINIQRPEVAPLINVEHIEEKQLTQGTVTQTIFEEKYSDSTAEMAQGFSTGMNYLNYFNSKTQSSFAHMDEKYDKISQGMFAVVSEIKNSIDKTVTSNEERNKTFETRMEKTEKNIESLLKILAEKK